MYEVEMTKAGIPFETFKRELEHIDRCKAEGVTSGFVKIHVKAGTDEMIGMFPDLFFPMFSGPALCAMFSGPVLSQC
jgi:hypothetical protein